LLEDVEFELDSSSSALPGVGGQQAGGPRRQQQNGKLKAIMPDERDKVMKKKKNEWTNENK